MPPTDSDKSASSTPTANRHFKKGAWILAAGLAGIVALLYYRFRRSPFDWNVFLATFAGVNWIWLLSSILLILFTYGGRALRWEVMLRPARAHPSLWNITSATVIGFTALVLLGRAGEVVRPYLISVKERVSFSSQMAAWLLERILDLLLVLLIFGIALARMPAAPHLGNAMRWVLHTGGYFITSIGALCILLLVAFRNFAVSAQRRILSALSFLPATISGRAERTMAAFVQGLECTRNPVSLALLVIYTIVEWVLIVGAHYCIFQAMPGTAWFGLNEVMIFLGFVAFGSVVQLPGIGGGVQAVSVLVLTEIFNIPAGEAWGMAILIWLLSWVLVVPFGLAFASHEGLNWKKISHIREDVEAQP